MKDWKTAVEVENTTLRTIEHGYSAPIISHLSQAPTSTTEVSSIPSYALYMDNVDYYVRVRNMTSDNQNDMKHYSQVQ